MHVPVDHRWDPLTQGAFFNPKETFAMNTVSCKQLRTKLFVLAVTVLMATVAAMTLAQTAFACQGPIGGC